ncbi:hypothetical protein ACIPHM_17855, partial [Pandoraea sp. NPDC087047]
NAKVGTDQKGDAKTGANATPGSELPKTGPVSVAPPVVVAAGDSASSTTRSGISAGVIEITDEASQLGRTGQTADEAVAAVNRDVSSDKDGSNALVNNFDKAQIETSFEIMQTLQREVGTFVGNRAKEYEALKEARKNETDPAKLAELDRQLDDAAKWAPGGRYRQIVTVITAAAGGNVTAGTGEFLQRAAVAYLQTLAVEKVKEIADELKSEAARTALHGVVGCAGAAAVGSQCGAGAVGGAASVVLGNLLNAVANTRNENLPQHEKEARMNLIESVVAGITAGTGGDATAASIAARVELENNQFQLPRGIVRAGAASASLGEFMAKHGASDEGIQQAQSDLLRGLGTDAAQPATALLKSWAILMAAAPSIATGTTAPLASIAAGGAIGGTANALVQLALNGEKEMSTIDVLIAVATGAATQGRGIVATVSTSAGGAALGAIIKGDSPFKASISAGVGSVVGTSAGKVISNNLAPLIENSLTAEITGAIGGAFTTEVTTNRIEKNLTIENNKQ